MSKKLLMIFLFLGLVACGSLGNKIYQITEPATNKYYGYEICELRYKYHSNSLPDKTCTNVFKRKCVERDYCKGDQTCISEVRDRYKPYLVKNDEESCLCRMEALKGNTTFKECNKIQ